MKNYQPNAIQRQCQASENGIKRTRKYVKPEWMKKYKLTYSQIAEYFGYNSSNSFHNAARKQQIIDGIEAIIAHIKQNETL